MDSSAPAPRADRCIRCWNVILDYGQTLEIAGVACLSTRSGVKCELADSNAGFILSQDEISTY